MYRLITLLAGLLLCFSASAQSSGTDKASDLLPGTWAMTTEIHGARIEAQTTFTSDGKLVENVKVIQDDTTTNMSASGNWIVEGDTIITTYTESSVPDLVPIGSVERDKITFVDAHQLSLVDAEGTAATMHKVR